MFRVRGQRTLNQMVAQHQNQPRKWWSRRTADNLPYIGPETPAPTPDATPDATVAASPVATPVETPVEPPEHAVFQIGDSIVFPETHGTPALTASDHAAALLDYLGAKYANRWIASASMEACLYGEFLGAQGWPPRPWRSVSRAMKKLTRKREKPMQVVKDGKLVRRTVTEFKIPVPA